MEIIGSRASGSGWMFLGTSPGKLLHYHARMLFNIVSFAQQIAEGQDLDYCNLSLRGTEARDRFCCMQKTEEGRRSVGLCRKRRLGE